LVKNYPIRVAEHLRDTDVEALLSSLKSCGQTRKPAWPISRSRKADCTQGADVKGSRIDPSNELHWEDLMTSSKLKRLTLSFVGATAVLVAFSGNAVAAKLKATAKVSQVNQPVSLPPQGSNFGVADSTASCGQGTILVGGGAQFAVGTPLPTNIELFKSGPFEKAWNVRYNNNVATSQPATVSAICLKKKLSVRGTPDKATATSKVQQVVAPLQLPPQATNHGVAEANATCPNSAVLVGGGASFSSTVANLRVGLFESGPSGNAWHVRYDNDDSISQPATVTALCLQRKLNVKGGPRRAKARSKVQEVTQPVTLPPQAVNNGVAEADVACPGGTSVVGGGGLFTPGASLPDTNIELFESGPRGNAWHVRFNSGEATSQAVTVTAICLRKTLPVT
jgi:hypothetical protein